MMRWFPKIHSATIFATIFLILLVTPTPTDANIRLCGQRLTTTLLAICRNQLCGGGMGAFKRSAVESSPWVAATRSLFQLHHQRKRGGIATECCEKRCSFSYLKTYCCNDDDDLLV